MESPSMASTAKRLPRSTTPTLLRPPDPIGTHGKKSKNVEIITHLRGLPSKTPWTSYICGALTGGDRNQRNSRPYLVYKFDREQALNPNSGLRTSSVGHLLARCSGGIRSVLVVGGIGRVAREFGFRCSQPRSGLVQALLQSLDIVDGHLHRTRLTDRLVGGLFFLLFARLGSRGSSLFRQPRLDEFRRDQQFDFFEGGIDAIPPTLLGELVVGALGAQILGKSFRVGDARGKGAVKNVLVIRFGGQVESVLRQIWEVVSILQGSIKHR